MYCIQLRLSIRAGNLFWCVCVYDTLFILYIRYICKYDSCVFVYMPLKEMVYIVAFESGAPNRSHLKIKLMK